MRSTATLTVAFAVLAIGPSPASAGTRKLSLSASLRSVAADNLFLTDGGRATLMLEASADAAFGFQDERRNGKASMRLGTRRYSRDFDSEAFGRANFSGSYRTSERLTLSATVSGSRERLAEVEQDIASAIDPRRLSTSLEATVAAAWQHTERSSFNPSLSIRRQSFDGRSVTPGTAPLRGFSSIGAGLGFSRTLSERLSLGLDVHGSADVFGQGVRSGQVTSGANARLAIDETTNASARIGVSKRIGGSDQFDSAGLGLIGGADLCRRWVNRNGCMSVSLSRDANALGYARRVTGGLEYDWRLGKHSSLEARADYSRADQPGRRFQFVTAAVSGSQRISERVAAGLSAGYRRRSGLVTAGSAFVGLNLSITSDRTPL